MLKYIYSIFILLVVGCNQQVQLNENKVQVKIFPKYAKGFYLDGNTLVFRSVSDSTKTTSNFDLDSLLITRKLITYSATHIALAHKLGVVDSVIGASYIPYIHNKKLQENYESGKVKEVPAQLNEGIETVLDLQPDFVMVSPEQYVNAIKAKELGVPLIPNSEYMENTPLARLEWIKVFGYLYNKQSKADSIFTTIEKKYLTLKAEVQNLGNKTIFSSKPYQGNWFIPGGQSYKANLFKDAGVDYVFDDNTTTGSFQVDFETILDNCLDTDFWEFVAYSDSLSYTDLLKENTSYSNFEAIKNKQIVFCNTKKIDLYESGLVEPHIILADLIHAFHPDILPNHIPKYYHLLK